jgi:hypothetical protein
MKRFRFAYRHEGRKFANIFSEKCSLIEGWDACTNPTDYAPIRFAGTAKAPV